jgi:hypothetical protein
MADGQHVVRFDSGQSDELVRAALNYQQLSERLRRRLDELIVVEPATGILVERHRIDITVVPRAADQPEPPAPTHRRRRRHVGPGCSPICPPNCQQAGRLSEGGPRHHRDEVRDADTYHVRGSASPRGTQMITAGARVLLVTVACGAVSVAVRGEVA